MCVGMQEITRIHAPTLMPTFDTVCLQAWFKAKQGDREAQFVMGMIESMHACIHRRDRIQNLIHTHTHTHTHTHIEHKTWRFCPCIYVHVRSHVIMHLRLYVRMYALTHTHTHKH